MISCWVIGQGYEDGAQPGLEGNPQGEMGRQRTKPN